MSDKEIDHIVSSTIDHEAILEILMDSYGDRINRFIPAPILISQDSGLGFGLPKTKKEFGK